MKKEGFSMEWGKFLACLFLGGFGVHKFIENKTG